MIRGIREWFVFIMAMTFLGLLLWKVLSVPASSATLRTRLDGLRVSSVVARVPSEVTSPMGSDLYELGRSTAKTEIQLEAAKAELYELERVVYFSDCIERRSGKAFQVAFRHGVFNEACRSETQRMTAEQISQAAQAIIARKKAP